MAPTDDERTGEGDDMGSRRRTWTLALGIVLALMITACGGADESTADGEQATTEAAAEQDEGATEDGSAADGEQAAVECEEPDELTMAQAVLPPKFAMLTP